MEEDLLSRFMERVPNFEFGEEESPRKGLKSPGQFIPGTTSVITSSGRGGSLANSPKPRTRSSPAGPGSAPVRDPQTLSSSSLKLRSSSNLNQRETEGEKTRLKMNPDEKLEVLVAQEKEEKEDLAREKREELQQKGSPGTNSSQPPGPGDGKMREEAEREGGPEKQASRKGFAWPFRGKKQQERPTSQGISQGQPGRDLEEEPSSRTKEQREAQLAPEDALQVDTLGVEVGDYKRKKLLVISGLVLLSGFVFGTMIYSLIRFYRAKKVAGQGEGKGKAGAALLSGDGTRRKELGELSEQDRSLQATHEASKNYRGIQSFIRFFDMFDPKNRKKRGSSYNGKNQSGGKPKLQAQAGEGTTSSLQQEGCPEEYTEETGGKKTVDSSCNAKTLPSKDAASSSGAGQTLHGDKASRSNGEDQLSRSQPRQPNRKSGENPLAAARAPSSFQGDVSPGIEEKVVTNSITNADLSPAPASSNISSFPGSSGSPQSSSQGSSQALANPRGGEKVLSSSSPSSAPDQEDDMFVPE